MAIPLAIAAGVKAALPWVAMALPSIVAMFSSSGGRASPEELQQAIEGPATEMANKHGIPIEEARKQIATAMAPQLERMGAGPGAMESLALLAGAAIPGGMAIKAAKGAFNAAKGAKAAASAVNAAAPAATAANAVKSDALEIGPKRPPVERPKFDVPYSEFGDEAMEPSAWKRVPTSKRLKQFDPSADPVDLAFLEELETMRR